MSSAWVSQYLQNPYLDIPALLNLQLYEERVLSDILEYTDLARTRPELRREMGNNINQADPTLFESKVRFLSDLYRGSTGTPEARFRSATNQLGIHLLYHYSRLLGVHHLKASPSTFVASRYRGLASFFWIFTRLDRGDLKFFRYQFRLPLSPDDAARLRSQRLGNVINMRQYDVALARFGLQNSYIEIPALQMGQVQAPPLFAVFPIQNYGQVSLELCETTGCTPTPPTGPIALQYGAYHPPAMVGPGPPVGGGIPPPAAAPLPTAPIIPAIPAGLPTLPTGFPAGLPTGLPTGFPAGLPTGLPTGLRAGFVSRAPMGAPIGFPTGIPTGLPTGLPAAGLPGARPTLPTLPAVAPLHLPQSPLPFSPFSPGVEFAESDFNASPQGSETTRETPSTSVFSPTNVTDVEGTGEPETAAEIYERVLQTPVAEDEPIASFLTQTDTSGTSPTQEEEES